MTSKLLAGRKALNTLAEIVILLVIVGSVGFAVFGTFVVSINR